MKNGGLGTLGPAPVRGSGAGPRLSGQRAVVLERLQSGAPTTISALAAELGVHPNTVREHLGALVGRGLAVRGQEQRRGRGRPAWVYAAADNVEPDPRVRDYAGLATALAAQISRAGDDPAAAAMDAGRAWGRELAAGSGGRPATSRAARQRVIDLLRELGFDPHADSAATTAALRRCPLLDAARRYPGVVCQVHLGLVRGAMEVVGGDPQRTDLRPFAEPGACRLRLLTDR